MTTPRRRRAERPPARDGRRPRARSLASLKFFHPLHDVLFQVRRTVKARRSHTVVNEKGATCVTDPSELSHRLAQEPESAVMRKPRTMVSPVNVEPERETILRMRGDNVEARGRLFVSRCGLRPTEIRREGVTPRRQIRQRDAFAHAEEWSRTEVLEPEHPTSGRTFCNRRYGRYSTSVEGQLTPLHARSAESLPSKPPIEGRVFEGFWLCETGRTSPLLFS